MAGARILIRERVLDDLRAMIHDGRLRAGQRLLEADVVRAYGVSRSPAQFALAALCDEHRLVRAAGRGYVVGRALQTTAHAMRAQLHKGTIAAQPGWQRIHSKVEHEVATRILFRSFGIHEERLARRFGVSRTVARDVLTRMHAGGLIIKERGGRWRAERLTPGRVHDLYELRWLLEPPALVDVAPRIPFATWVRMQEQLDVIAHAFPEVRGTDLDRIENDLHVALLRECRNVELVRALRPTQLLLIANRYMFDDYLGIPLGISRASLYEHRKVIALARSGRHEAAAGALREHLEHSLGHWLKRLNRMAAVREPRRPSYVTVE